MRFRTKLTGAGINCSKPAISKQKIKIKAKKIAFFYFKIFYRLTDFLSAWCSVKWNVFPEYVPPFVVGNCFSSYDGFQDFFQ